jgi:hypothetical protein
VSGSICLATFLEAGVEDNPLARRCFRNSLKLVFVFTSFVLTELVIVVREVAIEGRGPEATRLLLLFGSGVDISNNFNSLSRFRLNASFRNNFSGLTGLGFCSSQPSTFPLSPVLIDEEEPTR